MLMWIGEKNTMQDIWCFQADLQQSGVVVSACTIHYKINKVGLYIGWDDTTIKRKAQKGKTNVCKNFHR